MTSLRIAPPGQPPRPKKAPTKRRPLVVSVTELSTFQKCRRRWWLWRQWGRALQAPNFWFGRGIHVALEAYYLAKQSERSDAECASAMFGAYLAWGEEALELVENEYMGFWAEAERSYREILRIGFQMLENYLEYERETTTPLGRPIMVERRLFVSLGRGNQLTAQLDLLSLSEHDALLVTDHKSSNGFRSSGQTLDIDPQMTGYAYMVWRLLGRKRLPDDIVYNVLLKAIPAEPRQLKKPKDGRLLSVAKTQQTTYNKMLKAIQAAGEDPEDYEEFLEMLEQRGWSDFFERESSSRNEAQVRNFEHRAQVIFEEMRRVLTNPELAIPNPSVMACPRCPYLSVCNAIEDGSDWQHLLDTSFDRISDDPWQTPPRYLEELADG